MNLKNYTSTVSPESSVSRIEKSLSKMGAKYINKEYGGGILVGISFVIELNGNSIVFKLPAKANIVFDVMWKQVSRPHKGTKEKVLDQAARTAWKIIADWVEVQASMIYLEQAEVTQVFMPYAITQSGQSIYELFKEGGMKMLNSGK